MSLFLVAEAAHPQKFHIVTNMQRRKLDRGSAFASAARFRFRCAAFRQLHLIHPPEPAYALGN